MLINKLILSIQTFIPSILLVVAFYTVSERKVMASIQRRRGPNVVGFWGTLQAVADGVKLILKEIVIPQKSNFYIFILAPMITIILSFIGWSVIPFSWDNVYANSNLGLLFIFAVSSLGVYGVIISGWASNSKYAFLGALRSTAQMISYEVSIGLIIIPIALMSGSFNLHDIVSSQSHIFYFWPLLPLFFIFFVSALAETNRAPFDLPEAEAEIVAGYNVEYSSIIFAMFFLGEYSSMLIMSSLCVLFFLGGWIPIFDFLPISPELWFAIKTIFIAFMFIFVRANFPRFRYDQLMDIGWKCFLPVTLAYLLVIASLLYLTGSLPVNYLLNYNLSF